MAGLVPAIHALPVELKTWMPGTRPGMTSGRDYSPLAPSYVTTTIAFICGCRLQKYS
jgi:hypothetical protein